MNLLNKLGLTSKKNKSQPSIKKQLQNGDRIFVEFGHDKVPKFITIFEIPPNAKLLVNLNKLPVALRRVAIPEVSEPMYQDYKSWDVSVETTANTFSWLAIILLAITTMVLEDDEGHEKATTSMEHKAHAVHYAKKDMFGREEWEVLLRTIKAKDSRASLIRIVIDMLLSGSQGLKEYLGITPEELKRIGLSWKAASGADWADSDDRPVMIVSVADAEPYVGEEMWPDTQDGASSASSSPEHEETTIVEPVPEVDDNTVPPQTLATSQGSNSTDNSDDDFPDVKLESELEEILDGHGSELGDILEGLKLDDSDDTPAAATTDAEQATENRLQPEQDCATPLEVAADEEDSVFVQQEKTVLVVEEELRQGHGVTGDEFLAMAAAKEQHAAAFTPKKELPRLPSRLQLPVDVHPLPGTSTTTAPRRSVQAAAFVPKHEIPRTAPSSPSKASPKRFEAVKQRLGKRNRPVIGLGEDHTPHPDKKFRSIDMQPSRPARKFRNSVLSKNLQKKNPVEREEPERKPTVPPVTGDCKDEKMLEETRKQSFKAANFAALKDCPR